MIDLETLGTSAGCSILSIGAIAFDPDTKQIGPEFYIVVNRQDQIDLGFREDRSTTAWWNDQSVAARTVLTDAESTGAAPLAKALDLFAEYLQQFDLDQVKIWGNGASFDNAILCECYRKLGFNTPWKFWNDRCYRTAKALFPGPPLQRIGTYHNALDDAKSQANHLMGLLS